MVGDGFIRVLAGDTPAYTRAGSFTVDFEGNIVTPEGYFVDPRITIPAAERISVRPDGTVIAIIDAQAGDTQEIGRIQATRFQNPLGLVPFGDNLWLEGANSGPPNNGDFGEEGFPHLQAGFLEESNVDLAVELTDELAVQRVFQANLRVFQATDEIVGQTIELLA